MSDSARTALAFLLILGILVIWSLLSRSRRPTETAPVEQPDTVAVVEPQVSPLQKEPEHLSQDGDTIIVEREHFRLVLSTIGAAVTEFFLKEHNVSIVPDEGALFVSMLDDGTPGVFTYRIWDDSVVFTVADHETDLRKTYYFNDPYGFELTTDGYENGPYLLSLKAGLAITEKKNQGEDLRHFDIFVKNEKVSSIKGKVKDTYEYKGSVDWFGLRSKYFFLVIQNRQGLDHIMCYKLKDEKDTDASFRSTPSYQPAAFGCYFLRGGGDRFGAEFRSQGMLKIGVQLLPVHYNRLAAFDKGYEQITSGGLLGPISRLFLWVLNLFYAIFRNYGLAIILFAIIIKAIFFPLSRQMIRSQHKMQMIQPELKKLQSKYKEDPQRLNQEMMHLYKTYKVNPFSGCLPLLIQMPIFFALYQTLITSIEFRQAPFMLWITDLSMKDPYYVLPIIMGAMMMVQSFLTTVDPRQRYMVIVMPLVMVFIFLNFPSGLQLYWFSYNILTLVEHIITKRGGIK